MTGPQVTGPQVNGPQLTGPQVNGPQRHAVEIATRWPDLETLRTRAAASRGAWLLAEDAGRGTVAVGPVFGPDEACFECYIARRVANGGRECLPAIRPTAAQTDAIGALAPSLEVGAQVVLGGDGIPISRHRLLPVPGCGCGTRPPAGLRLLDAVSDRLGIVHRLEEWISAETGTAMCISIAATTAPVLRQEARCHGVAADREPDRARARAVGESLERYAAAFVPEGSDESVPATDLAARPAARMSSAKAYIPYRWSPSGTVQTSTGLAAGPTFEGAVRHAAAETAERHAFMSAWQRGQGFHVAPRLASDPHGLLAARIDTDLPLLVAVAGFESPAPPYAAVGLGASWSWTGAREAAVSEACAALEMLHRAAPFPADTAFPPRTLEDHAVAHAVRFDLAASRQRIWASDLNPRHDSALTASWRDYVAARPADRVAELTTPDVAALGVTVVRVAADGLQDLATDGRAEVLAGYPPHPIG